jgi:NAD(P)-dependent dehydrogenase (short-subunit alcohol dehydrogenase family)
VVFTPLWEEQAANHAQRRGIDERKVKEDLVKKIPLGRLGTPEEVANLVLFLASSRSDYMTGQAINLSGGSVLH